MMYNHKSSFLNTLVNIEQFWVQFLRICSKNAANNEKQPAGYDIKFINYMYIADQMK